MIQISKSNQNIHGNKNRIEKYANKKSNHANILQALCKVENHWYIMVAYGNIEINFRRNHILSKSENMCLKYIKKTN